MTTITLNEILGKLQELMDSGERDLGGLRFILVEKHQEENKS